ncbi:hypothetical protein ACWDOR_45670 [Streptosporangium canum]|uniref:hypothetical protein n=1 Tax=Streptosporangium canum TaxID=324952 RepID=UPI00369CB923
MHAVWTRSVQELRIRSPAAHRLLRLCSFFAAGPISMIMIYSDEMVRLLMPYDMGLREKLLLGRGLREVR